jgi:hypothetical protein
VNSGKVRQKRGNPALLRKRAVRAFISDRAAALACSARPSPCFQFSSAARCAPGFGGSLIAGVRPVVTVIRPSAAGRSSIFQRRIFGTMKTTFAEQCETGGHQLL